VTREPIPASELILALQCGGSDGYSGISANPALGAAVDLLVQNGGTAVLSETPEIYGAEHLLTRRAVTREVGEKIVERIRWWEEHCARIGGEMNNNPSPGNKAGGLTTILEKSLGAVAKGGTRKAVENGIARVKEMLPEANKVCREAVPASHLTLGLQCGGSDGYSGISANPALGAAVDLLVRHGGTAILSETPEIYGAEHLLTRRAVSKAVGEKLIERIHWF